MQIKTYFDVIGDFRLEITMRFRTIVSQNNA